MPALTRTTVTKFVDLVKQVTRKPDNMITPVFGTSLMEEWNPHQSQNVAALLYNNNISKQHLECSLIILVTLTDQLITIIEGWPQFITRANSCIYNTLQELFIATDNYKNASDIIEFDPYNKKHEHTYHMARNIAYDLLFDAIRLIMYV